jgi:hypothetical protein
MKPTLPQDTPLERDIAVHIFAASAALVGVCLTVISIVRSYTVSMHIQTMVDDLLAVNALVFLCACLLSYWALRTRASRPMHRLEAVADVVFLIGLGGMALACGLIVWAVSA